MFHRALHNERKSVMYVNLLFKKKGSGQWIIFKPILGV